MAYYEEGELVVRKSGGNLLREADQVHEALKRVGRSPVLVLHLR